MSVAFVVSLRTKLNGQLTGDSDTRVRASVEIERLRARAEGKGMISKSE